MKRKSRNDILSQPVKHSQQASGAGCMYHSFVALTGESSLLQHSNDNSSARFQLRVLEAGYLLIPVYCNGFQTAHACSFWPQYISLCKRDGVSEKRLLITCDGLGSTPSIHVIAVRMDFSSGLVTVSDPRRPGLPLFTFDQFEQTDYARKAVEVVALDSAVLDDYPPVPPSTSP